MRPRGVKRLFRFSSRTHDEVRADIRDELTFHLDMRIDELRRLGSSEPEARAQAIRELGDGDSAAAAAVASARHDDRVERRRRLGQIVSEIRQDATIALRMLGRSPGFAIVGILTLAIGIGANTAIFSALDAVLLRPLPYPEPERLVQVVETLETGSPNSVSGGAYLDWRQHQTQFIGLTLLNIVSYNLRGRGAPERLTGMEASHELLDVLGVMPILGRGFLPEDDRPGGRNDVVLLTEELWRSRFGADPSLLNNTIVLDEVPRTVVGILPRGAWLFREHGFFVPALLQPGTSRARRVPHWAVVFGRLRPGASLAQADAELKAIKLRLASEYPAFKQKWNVAVQPLGELVAGPGRPPLLILLGAVALVLLIACANVANLLLARACHRQQEIAVRAALGATGGRIVRQVLTESAVLALLGGIAGIAVAYWGVALVQHLTADIVPVALTPRLNERVLAFSLLLSGATGLLFGILPALRARKTDLNDTLKNGGKSATAGGRRRTQSTLVVAEIALTVVLLASTGLLLRSLANTAAVDPGFEPARALAFDLSLPKATYDSPDKSLAFSAALLERLRAIPGVEAAGAGLGIPFSGGANGEYLRRVGVPDDRAVLGGMDYVSPGYLEALGARLLAGRTLTDADNRQGGPRVAVISASTARLLFPDCSPIGEELSIIFGSWRIVGVIGDMVDRRLDAVPRPFAYVPQAFNPVNFSVVLRTPLDPMGLVSSVRGEVARLDAGVALANPRALDEAMTRSMASRRSVLTLVGAFTASALLLACIGLYGVMAYSVATRRREICIRMALGALRGDVARDVLRDGLRLMAVGLVLGLIGAYGVSRLLASELYQVPGTDPAVIAGTVLAVAVVVIAACWMPAARATRFEPMAALRND